MKASVRHQIFNGLASSRESLHLVKDNQSLSTLKFNTRSHLQHHEEFVQVYELILKQGLNWLCRVRKVNNQIMGIFAFCKLFNNVTFTDTTRTFNHQCASRCLMLFPIEQSFVYFPSHVDDYSK